ncbi:hypothetical protein GGS24DRAFT_494363 [Hypoxylon argillaceum]|nr:hypothetical protein GGS24DRAFT_494363 [Hypoxylon argillaceum]KAI1145626.1 hypothetical protein F4825DRAFT_473727 [Nemania diffusa]
MSLDQIHLLPEMAQQAILNGPALDPPPGIMPNFDNPPNGNAIGLAITTVSISISTAALVLAAYVKLYRVRKAHLEDFFGLTVGVCYCVYDTARAGLLIHQWDVRVRDLSPRFYNVHVGALAYAVAILLFKAAILLQWLRIFVARGTKGAFYWTCHALIWVNFLFYSSLVVTLCASCKPYRRVWDKTTPGTCSAKQEIIILATAVGNLISDLIIFLLPQRVIWQLHIKVQKKAGLAFIFFMGILGIISASFRVHASVRYLLSSDKTYTLTIVALWGVAELTCAILIFCVPSIPKLFRDSGASNQSSARFASWIKFTTRGSKIWSSLVKPSSKGNPGLNSLSDSNYGYDMPILPNHSGIAQNSLPQIHDQAMEKVEPPKAGILRTTRISTTTTDESRNSTMEEIPRFQNPWDRHIV